MPFLKNKKGSIQKSMECKNFEAQNLKTVQNADIIPYNSKAATGQLVNPSFGGWVFCFSAPSLWNYILKHICDLSSLHDFKTHLKTYIFLSCFSDL